MRTNYLFSGLLMCDLRANGPLTIVGGSSVSLLPLHDEPERLEVQERAAHQGGPGAHEDPRSDSPAPRASPEGKAHVRERIAGFLANQSNSELGARIAESRERIAKTSAQVKEMVDFVKRGERSETVGAQLRELESYLRAEKATLSKLLDDAEKPARLPSVEDVAGLAYDLDKRLAQDIATGRAQLVRWLRTGSMRVSQESDGAVHAKGALNLRAVLADAEKTKTANHLAVSNSGRYTGVVAGAGFEPATFGL